MRSFEDEQGNVWQTAVLDASYGNAVLVFSGLKSAEVLKSELYAAKLDEAEQMLEAMDVTELRQRLASAEPFTQA